jgi:hypothetical protein
MKILPVGAELFNTDSQTHKDTDGQGDRNTEMAKIIIAFRNFVYAPENEIHYPK